MIEHYIWLSSQQGDFYLAVSGFKEPINLGDYLEGRFLGSEHKIERSNGTIYFYTFEVSFSACHNKDNTMVTLFALPSRTVIEELTTLMASKETITIIPKYKIFEGYEWYWPHVKELV